MSCVFDRFKSSSAALLLFFLFTASCLTSPPALAQADTAQARQVFAEVNQQLAQLKKTSLKAKRPDVAYTSNVKVWSDDSGVRKLEVTDLDDSGDVMTEYYYEGGKLVFVYQAVKGFNDANKQVTRHEERQYFRADKMFKWLSGTDKAEVGSKSSDFTAEATARLAASAFYAKAAAQGSAAKN
ncbi:MAG: hypothetical protein ABL923_10585 [Burkholderiaceae bacterium]